ncbi:MAG: lytic transglycosylase domain-containing protein, partial [Myxococcota bacterium]
EVDSNPSDEPPEVDRCRDRARRKRKPPELPRASEVSWGAQPLLRALEGERAMVVAVRRPREGLAELEQLIDRAPIHPERTRWHLQAAQLALVAQEPVRLAQHALQALSGEASGALASEALWLVALAHIRGGRLDAARPLLELSAQHSRGRDSDIAIALSATDPAARAHYWLARIDEEQGHVEKARAGFVEVQRAYPWGVYHLLSVDACVRLGGAPEQLRMTRHLPGVALPNPFSPVPTTPADRAIDVHLHTHPQQALTASLDQARYTVLGPGRHQRLLDLSHTQLDRAQVYWLAYTLPPVGGWDVRHGEAYRRFDRPDPRPHRRAIGAAARLAGLDPEWVLALIRQESGFQARACSGSRACGLMQLKMSAAQTISRAEGIPFAGTTEALFQTDVNLRLGTALLARLERKTGDPIRALASYNAGPGAVRRWKLEADAIAPDLFLELMPDRRTRAYVIGILVRYGFYAALLDSGQIRRLVERPELP